MSPPITSIFIKTIAVLLVLSVPLTAFSETYKIRKIEGDKEDIAAQILQLALSKVEPDVNFVQSDEIMTEARLVQAIQEKEIDILWAGADKAKEDVMRTVRIPILKGLLGHRIFIIRKSDAERFAAINSRQDLNQLSAGQGTFWGDTKVLQNAKLPTVTTIKYANLFPMLEGGRFDYFPRAVHEPWVEVSSRPELDLVVDQNVMLIYPFALWFYVHQDNTSLHDKIQRGFEAAIKDGSYDELFFGNQMIKDALTKANLAQRKIFRVDNPYMHPDTPTDRKEFWLNIDEL